jgi:hypothetical protein
MLKGASHSSPRVINVDQNPAYPPAVEQLKEEGTLPDRTQLRQCKHLNNMKPVQIKVLCLQEMGVGLRRRRHKILAGGASRRD